MTDAPDRKAIKQIEAILTRPGVLTALAREGSPNELADAIFRRFESILGLASIFRFTSHTKTEALDLLDRVGRIVAADALEALRTIPPATPFDSVRPKRAANLASAVKHILAQRYPLSASAKEICGALDFPVERRRAISASLDYLVKKGVAEKTGHGAFVLRRRHHDETTTQRNGAAAPDAQRARGGGRARVKRPKHLPAD